MCTFTSNFTQLLNKNKKSISKCIHLLENVYIYRLYEFTITYICFMFAYVAGLQCISF